MFQRGAVEGPGEKAEHHDARDASREAPAASSDVDEGRPDEEAESDGARDPAEAPGGPCARPAGRAPPGRASASRHSSVTRAPSTGPAPSRRRAPRLRPSVAPPAAGTAPATHRPARTSRVTASRAAGPRSPGARPAARRAPRRPPRRPMPPSPDAAARLGAPAPHRAVRLRPYAGRPGPAGPDGQPGHVARRPAGRTPRPVVRVDQAAARAAPRGQDDGHEPPAPVRADAVRRGTGARHQDDDGADHNDVDEPGHHGLRSEAGDAGGECCRRSSTLRKSRRSRIGARVDPGGSSTPTPCPPTGGAGCRPAPRRRSVPSRSGTFEAGPDRFRTDGAAWAARGRCTGRRSRSRGTSTVLAT